ncbi:MAG: hypothetical protein IPK83_08380 [Planctomycetes bacterium]|nr:hypothetical protein [Planctomycetota bacterium]
MKLRAAADHQIQQQRGIIEKSRKARPRKLLSIADAVFSGDVAATTKGMQAFLQTHGESVRNHHRLDLWLSLDMTVLWHLAKRRGMGDLELPVKLMPHIIRL